jgi:uncharacterized protein (DUF433 family)
MIQLNFLNAVVEDDGSGLEVNGKKLDYIISAALGSIKRIPGRYDYIKSDDRGKPFKSRLCNVSVTIDDRTEDITETVSLSDYEDMTLVDLEEYLKTKGDESEHSQETQQADTEE